MFARGTTTNSHFFWNAEPVTPLGKLSDGTWRREEEVVEEEEEGGGRRREGGRRSAGETYVRSRCYHPAWQAHKPGRTGAGVFGCFIWIQARGIGIWDCDTQD